MRLFAVAVAATGVFGLAALLIARGAPAAHPIDGHPAPVLFDTVRIAPLGAQLADEKPIADRLFRDWAGQHPGRDDAAFTRFAIAQLPGPPDSATQAGSSPNCVRSPLSAPSRVSRPRTGSGCTCARRSRLRCARSRRPSETPFRSSSTATPAAWNVQTRPSPRSRGRPSRLACHSPRTRTPTSGDCASW